MLQKMTQTAQEQPKRRRVFNESTCSNLEDKLIHEIECLKRENKEQKVIIEKFEGRMGEEGPGPRDIYLI